MQNHSNNQKNLEFFQKELPGLLTNVAYKGKYIVINAEEIKGAYDSFDLALNFAVANFPPSEFIIQQVIDESECINFICSASA